MIVMRRHQITLRRIASALAVTAGLAVLGCGQGTPSAETLEYKKATLEAADAVAACLPSNVTLQTKTTDRDGSSETVQETLARLKVMPKRGKLFDHVNREVVFLKTAAAGRAILSDPEYKKLCGKHTVVLLAP